MPERLRSCAAGVARGSVAVAFLLGAGFLAVFVACSPGDASTPDGDAGITTDAPLDRLAAGELAVRRRACGSCHQSSDPADGVMSGQTTPRLGTLSYPANLTPDVETGIGGWPAARIVFAMRHGVDVDDQPLCAAMPRFDLEDEEAYAIAEYLRSLPPVHHAIPASTCPPLKPKTPPDAGTDADASEDASQDASQD
jgi:mono/diheme cytochrome c family protein